MKIFSGLDGHVISSFFAYAPTFTGGIFLAVGDVNGDTFDDIITGAGAGGGPHVQVFDGPTNAVLLSFFAYAPTFTGGISVAAGDLSGDNRADIVTGAGPGGGPHVQTFNGVTGAAINSYFAYVPSFTGGVNVAVANTDGTGNREVVVGPGAGGTPEVKVFDGLTGAQRAAFLAYAANFTGGVRVGAADRNGDGIEDIVTIAGPTGGPHVRSFDGLTLREIDSFFAYAPTMTAGGFIAG